jgi:hypothetical protein
MKVLMLSTLPTSIQSEWLLEGNTGKGWRKKHNNLKEIHGTSEASA